MSGLVRPFPARIVRSEWAERVVSPAYDGLNAEARRALMAANPHVFLHVTRSPEDSIAEGGGLDELTAGNAAALARLLEAGAYDQPADPAVYLYRLSLDGHTQTGIVADLPVDAYSDGRLRRHERTREDREAVLAKHLSALSVVSSPVAVTYRAATQIDELVAALAEDAPILQFRDASGLEQTLWRVDDPAIITSLDEAFEGVPLYITDGHHRTAAALRLRDERVSQGLPVGDFDSVLCVLFPDDQVRVYEFNRRVSVSAEAEVHAALAALAEMTDLHPAESAAAAKPRAQREFAVYGAGSWSRFSLQGDVHLDARLLDEKVLRPILGVVDSARTDRVEYVPGTAGLEELAQRCDRLGGVGLAMFPEPLEDLMRIADEGGVLPPKSTFFHPKARSGIFLRFRKADNSD